MLELIAFTLLQDLKVGDIGQRSAARAEDEFYRTAGQSRPERILAWLLALRATKKGRDMRDPSSSCVTERQIRQRVACRPVQASPRSGIAGSAT